MAPGPCLHGVLTACLHGAAAAGSWDETIRLWDVESATTQHVFTGHNSKVCDHRGCAGGLLPKPKVSKGWTWGGGAQGEAGRGWLAAA